MSFCLQWSFWWWRKPSPWYDSVFGCMWSLTAEQCYTGEQYCIASIENVSSLVFVWAWQLYNEPNSSPSWVSYIRGDWIVAAFCAPDTVVSDWLPGLLSKRQDCVYRMLNFAYSLPPCRYSTEHLWLQCGIHYGWLLNNLKNYDDRKEHKKQDRNQPYN